MFGAHDKPNLQDRLDAKGRTPQDPETSRINAERRQAVAKERGKLQQLGAEYRARLKARLFGGGRERD